MYLDVRVRVSLRVSLNSGEESSDEPSVVEREAR